MKKTAALFIISMLFVSVCFAMGGEPPKEAQKGKTMTKAGKNSTVIIETSKGSMKVELYADKAPITVKNFLDYVDSNFYDGTIFHRVIPDFMIQGGGFTSGMKQKMVLAPVKNEANNGLSNDKGTLAMARTQVVDSATAQFFINTVDNPFLNFKDDSVRGYGYCVFGKVVEGMETVDAIKAVKTGTSGYYQDVPAEDVTIISVKLAE